MMINYDFVLFFSPCNCITGCIDNQSKQLSNNMDYGGVLYGVDYSKLCMDAKSFANSDRFSGT